MRVAVQALPNQVVSIRGVDGVDVDPSAGRAPGQRTVLGAAKVLELQNLLKRNEFFRDCLAPQSLDLKVCSHLLSQTT